MKNHKRIIVKVLIWIGWILGIGIINGILMTAFNFKLGFLFEIGAVIAAIYSCKAYDEKYYQKTNRDDNHNLWKCPKCGKENSNFFKKCECGYESNNSNEK